MGGGGWEGNKISVYIIVAEGIGLIMLHYRKEGISFMKERTYSEKGYIMFHAAGGQCT